jgi:hypothetical protein
MSAKGGACQCSLSVDAPENTGFRTVFSGVGQKEVLDSSIVCGTVTASRDGGRGSKRDRQAAERVLVGISNRPKHPPAGPAERIGDQVG